MRQVHNVLVYPCETRVGAELVHCLRYSPHFRVSGCAATEVRSGYAFDNSAGALPRTDTDEFLPELTRIIRGRSIDFVYPASDEALTELAELAADGLVEAEVIAPPVDVCRLCASKPAIHAFFSGKLPLPERYRREQLAAIGVPAWAVSEKRWATGRLVDGRYGALSEDEAFFEYMPGAEFAVDCFSGGADGALLFVSGRERRVVADGDAVNDVLCARPEFRRFAEAVNAELKLRGAWCFLLRGDHGGTLRLMGIRPGLGLGAGLQRARGVNLPAATLRDRLGMKVDLSANPLPEGTEAASVDRRQGDCFRMNLRYDTAYLDLENTVVVDGGVDLDAVRFIFSCRNRGVRVVLVGRGAEPPEKLLERHSLSGLFDQVLWVGEDEAKSSVMTSRGAIFVDDDQEERREAAARLGIPVFDPSAFAALAGV